MKYFCERLLRFVNGCDSCKMSNYGGCELIKSDDHININKILLRHKLQLLKFISDKYNVDIESILTKNLEEVGITKKELFDQMGFENKPKR